MFQRFDVIRWMFARWARCIATIEQLGHRAGPKCRSQVKVSEPFPDADAGALVWSDEFNYTGFGYFG